MRKLGKKIHEVKETVEAYACSCSCNCYSCSCFCSCTKYGNAEAYAENGSNYNSSFSSIGGSNFTTTSVANYRL